MRASAKRVLKTILPRRWFGLLYAIRTGLRNLRILSVEYGQFESARLSRCVDRRGLPLPWYTYPAIEYISQLDLHDRVVFEYGLGNSTLFWAALAKKVIGVDHNKEWFDRVSRQAPGNVQLLLATEPKEYIGAIDRFDGFDVVIVDGIARQDCCREAVGRLNEGGVIILDNSDWHPSCTALLRDAGLLQVDMTGFGPIAAYTWVTSFFFHRKFNVPRRFDRQPIQVLRPQAASHKAGLAALLDWERGLRRKPLV